MDRILLAEASAAVRSGIVCRDGAADIARMRAQSIAGTNLQLRISGFSLTKTWAGDMITTPAPRHTQMIALFKSMGWAFALEIVLVAVFALSPYVPFDGGGESGVGYWILFIHLPSLWITAEVFTASSVPFRILVAALVTTMIWTVLFYAIHLAWQRARNRSKGV